jgi:hypothetical protein
MPLPMLKGLAKKAGHSEGDAERYWDEAKESAKKEGLKEGTPRFYRYTTGIMKRRMGLGSEHASTLEFGKNWAAHEANGDLEHHKKEKRHHDSMADHYHKQAAANKEMDGPNRAKASAHSAWSNAHNNMMHKLAKTGMGDRHQTQPKDIEHSSVEIAKSKKWSGKVTKNDKHDTPDKLFTHPASKVAKYLHEKFGAGEAIKKLTFYINRGGKNIHPADKKRLEGAKNKLEKHLKKAEAALETANSKTYVHHRKSKEEMEQHIETVKKFNALAWNEDQHKHKHEKANVDDREWDHNKDGSAQFLQSNPDTDPTWGITHQAGVEQDVDHEWNKSQKVLDQHHNQREAHGHREDAMESWQKYMQHKAASDHAKDADERQYHHDLAERFKTLAQIQTQKWKKHVEES